MKRCPKCGFENHRESPDCPKCGIIYEKFHALHDKNEEEDVVDEEVSEEEKEEEEWDPGIIEEEKKPFSFDFDKDEIIEAISEFFQKYYLYISIAVASFLLIIILLAIFTGGIKGKTGIVSWTKILGEEGHSSLLFDNIELLRKPEIPDENSPDLEETIICDMEKGSMVKVLKEIKDDFLKIEVLNGKCKGEIGYIPIDNFELMD